MPSTEDYLEFVLYLLGDVEGTRHRKMMGEYVLYYRNKVFGGIYDDRFLIKTTVSVRCLLPNAPQQLNYEGGSMMTVIDTDDRALITQIVEAMWVELPEPRKKR